MVSTPNDLASRLCLSALLCLGAFHADLAAQIADDGPGGKEAAPREAEERKDPRDGSRSRPAEVSGALAIDRAAALSAGVGAVSDDAAAVARSGLVAGRPIVRPWPTGDPPAIDGRLDDPVWRNATRITDFVQTSPTDGGAPTEATEVWMAYDRSHLYVAFYAHYSDVALIRANRVDRDRTMRDDVMAVMFDTFMDQQRAYRFSVNGYGVQSDAILNADGGGGPGGGGGGDTSWDTLFDTGGMLVADGWTAEMRIPFKSLRYPARAEGQPHSWGFQIQRSIGSKDETLVWSPVSRDIAGFMRQMGLLTGMTDLSTSRNLEILPTMTAIQIGSLDESTGAFGDDALEPDVGVNVKYGVTSNLTLDFTYNPDFSQIESDRPQIAVNQRFPLFFPELRPFFLEGRELFDTIGPINLVHTRTIVDPRHGAKLTGKVGRAAIGLLVANDEAPGKRDDAADPASGRTAQSVLGRARYDLYSESYVGAIFTDRAFMDAYSRLAGVDGRFRLGQTHSLQFIAAQADNLTESGEARSGSELEIAMRRQSRNLDYGATYSSVDPDFDTESGFVRRVDVRRLDGNVSYTWWPERTLISWGPSLSYLRNYDHRGLLQDEDVATGLNLRFAQNVFVRANARREMERFADVSFRKTSYSVGGGINTSRAISLNYGLSWGDAIRYTSEPFLGRSLGYDVQVNVQPTSRLRANVSLDASRLTDPRTHTEVFDVKILRALTTYQFSDRLLVRNITEYNTYDDALGVNLLLTYRVNAGTVLYAGVDDRLRDGRRLNDVVFPTSGLERTRRAFFLKFQYLFRY